MRIANWLLAAALLLVAGCGGGRRYATVTIPPRLELGQYGQIGLVTFSVENAKGTLHEFAAKRFAEEVLAASRGIEVLELGSADTLLRRVGERTFGAAAAQAVGASRDIPAVFAGHMKVSNAKPSGGISSSGVPHVEATVTAELTVGLYSTKSGGTLWRASAIASERVGSVAIFSGEPTFSAKDPNAAYGRLVNRLLAVVTRDLYPTYEQRQVLRDQ